MDKNGSVRVLLFFFVIVLGQSNAFSSRKLVATPDPDGSPNAKQEYPSSSPLPDDKKPDLSSVETPKTKDSPNVESKGLNDATTKKSSENSSDLKLDEGKNQDDKESKTFSGQSCKGIPICSDQEKTMIACIQDFVNGSDNLTLFVQNEKDLDLKVNIAFGKSVNNILPPFDIPAHATKEVNLTFSGDKSNKVILNAGNGDCELQISQSKTTPVNFPPNHKDANDPADSPAKPKDVNNHVESPTKPNEETSQPKDIKHDSPSKSKDINDLPKAKDVNDQSKSKVEDDPSKSKDINDPSKSKSKDVNGPSNSKSKDVDDLSKTKNTGPPSDPETSVDIPLSQNNFLDQLTFYSKQVTPIYGAYLAFLVALIIGGSWALCTLRKRRTRNSVPYQELEMGPTEPSAAVDVETAEGWDHDWDDDDWDDDDKAISSPGGGVQTKSISSNGLTSRATKKDGWDADWDD